MSNVFQQIAGAVSGTIKSVVIDSELLPGPITVDLSGDKTASNGGSFNVAAVLRPSVTVIGQDGSALYTSAPWGTPTDSRIPFFVVAGAAAVGLVIFGYGAFKLLKR